MMEPKRVGICTNTQTTSKLFSTCLASDVISNQRQLAGCGLAWSAKRCHAIFFDARKNIFFKTVMTSIRDYIFQAFHPFTKS